MLPQIIFLALQLMSLGIAMGKHGQEKSGKENAWVSFFALLIGWSLLYWGGFFDVFG